MMSQAASVDRSEGALSSVSVARQWMQRRLQPLVNSQKISRGLFLLIGFELGLGLVCPLPFAEAIDVPPHVNRGVTPPHAPTVTENKSRSGDTHHPEL